MKNIQYDKSFWRVFSQKSEKDTLFLLSPSDNGCRRVGFGAVKQYRQQTYIK